MGLTFFDSDLGTHQGRVARTTAMAGTGGHAAVLGHAQRGVFAVLEPGDLVELAQDVALAGDHAAVARVTVRGPGSTPAGYAWKLQWLAGGLVMAERTLPVGRTTATTLTAIVAGMSGPRELGLRLTLDGPPLPVELELPGVWVDDVALEQLGRPAVINASPAPGEQGVRRTAVVRIELVDVLGGGVDRAATEVWVGAQRALSAGQLAAAFLGPGAGVLPINHGWQITLVPLVPFASRARVAIRISARTLDGLGMLDAAYTFDCEDRTSPSLLAAFAPDLRQLELVFDERVTVAPTATVRLLPETRPAVAPSVVSIEAHAERLRAFLDRPLSPGARYRIETSGIEDAAGNAVVPPFDRAWLVPGAQPVGVRPRMALWRMLPNHIRRSDTSGELALFIACLQEVTDLILSEGDRWIDILDLRRAPEVFVDLMLADLGNPFPFELDLTAKRRLVATLVQLYRRKGTAPGIEQAVRFFFGLTARIRPYASRAARLGRARLGRDFRLGPSDQFRLYGFDVEVDRVLDDEERRRVRWLVEYAKPAHTHLVTIIEPAPPPPAAWWRLGSGRLARTTVLSAT